MSTTLNKTTLIFIHFAFILLVVSCSNKANTNANEIINKSISAYGGEKVYNSEITFMFREKRYKAKYNNENYRLERIFTEDSLAYQDVLTNSNFTRFINHQETQIDNEWKNKYSNSINSVIYFFRIPFNLTDKAVNKAYLGKTTINKQNYHKIKVTFGQDGGGKDYSDVFIYWINTTKFTVDYFAYSYETDGGGKRFRKMINKRKVNGLLVADYINYKPKNDTEPLENFDVYYENNGFEELSRIVYDDVAIEYH